MTRETSGIGSADKDDGTMQLADGGDMNDHAARTDVQENSNMAESVAPAASPDAPKPRLKILTALLPSFKSIEGWLTLSEGQMLYIIAAGVTEGCIVEVGSFRGRSTAALCAGVSVGKSGPVYAVDPHENFVGVKGAKFGPGDRREFFRTMIETRMVKHVRLLNSTSRALSPGWTRPVGMLFLDGDHRYESTLADFEAWRPHLLNGAMVVFADAQDDGPARVISEFSTRQMLTKIDSVGKLTSFRFSAQGKTPRIYPKLVVDESIVQKNLDTDTVAYNVYYGGGGKYMYQSIPKCACTTIKTVLLELEGLRVDDNEWKRHQKDNNKFPGANGMTERQLNELFRDRTKTFKFVVVRDPYTRLASAYKDKIRMETKLRAKFWLNIVKDAALEQGVELSPEITFEEFVRVVSNQPIEQMDSHWRPQYFEGRFGIIKFNFVGHMEMLHCDLPYILEQIDAPEYLHKKAAEQHNVTGAQMAIWDSVSAEVRQKFMKTFEIDFDTLRYPYRTPRIR